MSTEKTHGMGDTWRVFFNSELEENILASINIVKEDKNVIGLVNGKMVALIGLEPPIKVLVLIEKCETQHSILAAYPFLQIDNPTAVKITEIDEWESGEEAYISGSVNDTAISFFDSLYFLNKNKYKIGNTYHFNIAGLTTCLEKRTENVQFVAKSGPLMGETIDTANMVALIQNGNNSFEYCFPFDKFTNSTTIFESEFYQLNFLFKNAEDYLINIPLFVNSNQLNNYEPAQLDPVMGIILLHGYLVDSYKLENNFYNETGNQSIEENSNSLSKNSSSKNKITNIFEKIIQKRKNNQLFKKSINKLSNFILPKGYKDLKRDALKLHELTYGKIDVSECKKCVKNIKTLLFVCVDKSAKRIVPSIMRRLPSISEKEAYNIYVYLSGEATFMDNINRVMPNVPDSELESAKGRYKTGYDADKLPDGEGDFGTSGHNPILSISANGSIEYLNKLRYNGEKIQYEKYCSYLLKKTGYVDRYQISQNDLDLGELYFSPYHRRNSKIAPARFTLVDVK